MNAIAILKGAVSVAFRDPSSRVRLARVLVHDPYTFAIIRLMDHEHVLLEGVGFAKRNPVDFPDAERGLEIAIGRAEKDLARKLAEYDCMPDDLYYQSFGMQERLGSLIRGEAPVDALTE